MTPELITTLIVAVCILVGCLGIIVPVLPGSILILVSTLVWGFVLNSPGSWAATAVAGVCAVAGMTSSWVLTGRRLKDRGIPGRSQLVAGLLGIVGFFVVPVVGLPLGFVAGLLLMEYLRLRDWGPAWQATLVVLKALGIGIIIEFGCAVVAAGAFAVGALVYFL
ncbi:DUF456 domain-containing protein [Brevibacterium sp. 50QC2O2]|jgi:uncharacterized protein YqgC (DUF456 family)|uniref:DUF456 domain-containing protein n=1 Tax=Brevibacterium TaxID=1696 RepID=UPI00211D12F9|nr:MULTISPECIES: DUF456 domain-containing protein [unclassified Brevibacterium]MCQ9369097.1 DUF456 domain-containing protein [Brevibacterium sp. 91QC2O2]MCQ9385073.1 DUF456 domain-containing protein [Brevibacterium sp. 68QC2CO]MCQ9387771.1 DUF456 domain-containing protein [Brevibacterium sp. 50QC2O2]